MYELICFLGPAAITYGIVHGLVLKRRLGLVGCVAEWVAYAFLNVCITIMALEPYGKIQILTGAEMMPHIVYGKMGLLFAGIIAVVLGVVFSILFTRIDVKLYYDEEKDIIENEEK